MTAHTTPDLYPQRLVADCSSIDEEAKPGEESSLTDLETELQAMAAKMHRERQAAQGPQELLRPAKDDPRHTRAKSSEQSRPCPHISSHYRNLPAQADGQFYSKYSLLPKPVSISLIPSFHPPSSASVIIDPISVDHSKNEDISETNSTVVKDTPRMGSLKERIAAYLSIPEQKQPRGDLTPPISQRSYVRVQNRESKPKSMYTLPTFTPVLYTQIPHHLHKLSADRLVAFSKEAKSHIDSSDSTSRDRCHPQAHRKRPPSTSKSLTPVVQQLSFPSGCDWASLEQRQKSQKAAYD